MIFGAKNLLHHVMITHVRALAINSSKQPPLPCNYGRWLGAQFLCKKKSFPNYARTKRCACNSEVISSVKAKLEMTKYFRLQLGLFFDSCKFWKTLNGNVYLLDLVKVKRKSSEVYSNILLMGSISRLFPLRNVGYLMITAQMYLQLPLRQWGAGNVYILVLSGWR